MCSFLYSTKHDNQNIDSLNYYLKFRGPDHTTQTQIENNLFIHNLLSITGDFTPQPYQQDNIALVYNGEIYNYKTFGDYKSDGECLIPLYKQFGYDFIKQLDGEFAICLVDYNKKVLIISADIFKTKPLYIGYDENEKISCSTYRTPLELLDYKHIQKAEPNTTYIFSLETLKLLEKKSVYDFDLQQHKTTYDDWINAFKKAIIKRISNTEKNIFFGLSSGYDSGLIFSIINELNRDFYTFTLRGSENDEIIDKRFLLKSGNAKSFSLIKNSEDYNYSHQLIEKNTEPFYYTIHSSSSGYNEYGTLLINDGGSNNFATVCRAAKQKNCKICLSGTGADEIISDYGFNGNKIYQHSNFGGMFPEDLKTIFPWSSFYGSTLESYIAKEEYVGGSFGIEMRYPFLDKDVVQEFLWLHQDLKNKEYKAPIDYYFNLKNFPYSKLEKRGF